MNKTLIIYDNEGHIIQQQTGEGYRLPIGVPYLEVEIPVGKYAVSVNVETKEVILENIPPTETEILGNKISILEAHNKDLEDALVELAGIVGGA